MNFELPDTNNVQFKNFYSVGMAYEVQEVGRCIKAGMYYSVLLLRFGLIRKMPNVTLKAVAKQNSL